MLSKLSISINKEVSFGDNAMHLSRGKVVHTRNVVAEKVYAVGRALTKPCLRELSHATRLFGPHARPGKAYDGVDYGSAWKWSMRVLHTAELILLFVPTLMLAVVGVALKWLCAAAKPPAILLYNNDLTYKEYTGATVDDPLHPVTYNLGLMPSFIRNVNGMRSSIDRAHELVAQFEKEHEEGRLPDVLCLQEGFDHDAVKILLEGLSAFYPDILYNVAPNDAGLSSGLIVASKYEITSYSYRPFTNLKSEDKIPNKGLLGVKVKLNDTAIAVVYNTHLQSKYDAVALPNNREEDLDESSSVSEDEEKLTLEDLCENSGKYASARYQQIDQIRRWIESDVGEDKYELVALCGDFNVSNVYDGNYAASDSTGQASQEYKQAMGLLGDSFVDTFYQTHDANETRKHDAPKPRFLEHDIGDSNEESTLSEPTGSWYQRVNLTDEESWGSTTWNEHQKPLSGAILDHIFVHQNSLLQFANTEIRHFGGSSVQRSGMSDHLPVSACFYDADGEVSESDSSGEEVSDSEEG